MDLIITEKKENVFLNRFEVYGKVKFDGATPSNTQTAELVGKELGKNAELVVLKKLYSKFGSREAEILAYVYANHEAKKKAEVALPHTKKKTSAPTEKKE
jgi:ribosomal protein S24E